MTDFLLGVLRLIFEFILDVALYATGRIILPLMSFGRIKVAPWREASGRAREMPVRAAGDIVAGDGWCKFAGLLFWASIILLLVYFLARPLG